jgi:tetratricopeptide (TPR) repeat protein
VAEPTARMNKLLAMLEKQPGDPFLLYGLGMEHKTAGDGVGAIKLFTKVIERDPGYCYAYYQRGLAQESAGEVDAAKASYREGIAAAERKGDAHARGELEAALSMLE